MTQYWFTAVQRPSNRATQVLIKYTFFSERKSLGHCKITMQDLYNICECTCGAAKIRVYRSCHPELRPCAPPESRRSLLRVYIEAFLERSRRRFHARYADSLCSPKNVYSCVLLNKKTTLVTQLIAPPAISFANYNLNWF